MPPWRNSLWIENKLLGFLSFERSNVMQLASGQREFEYIFLSFSESM